MNSRALRRTVVNCSDPDGRIFAEVKGGNSRNVTATVVFRRGDVMHLISGVAKGNRLNYYCSVDSTTPVGHVMDFDVVSIHVPKPKTNKDM